MPCRNGITNPIGLRPWSVLCPIGQRPNEGPSPISFFHRRRQGVALPHIRRRSRDGSGSRDLGRAEPCLTSGGGAVAEGVQEIWAGQSPASHRAAEP